MGICAVVSQCLSKKHDAIKPTVAIFSVAKTKTIGVL